MGDPSIECSIPNSPCCIFSSIRLAIHLVSKRRILLVEDEPSIADAVCYSLQADGFEVGWSSTGSAAREMKMDLDPHLVVLDIGLPDVSGWDLGREFISEKIPVIFLTSRHSEADRVAGLEMGGDDYIVKPFSPRELVARVRVAFRREDRFQASHQATALEGLEIDKNAYRVFLDSEDMQLTRNEYRLLETLASRPGRVFSREELLEQAWNDPGASQDRTVDAHIKQLRSKFRALDVNKDPIETHRGFGYSLKRYW